ncbi:MAG: DNA polymerase III subunit delta [Verrucomicrobia bacterium]|nr:DNA polymerase III subunit delta [Cytophagales bacterium]
MQNPETIFKNLQARKFEPIYFLQGDEPFYLDKIADFIEKNALADHEKGFNQIICYGKDVTVGHIINQARKFPMMSEKTLVIVKEAQEIQDLAREEAQNLLEKYVMQPLQTTILVLVHKHKTLDGRKSLTKTLDKFAVLVESKKIYENKVPDWVLSYGKENGLQIQPDAARLLTENIGNDLSRLANEIDKLCLNLKDKKLITTDLVEQYIGISKEYNTFELQKALIIKDVLKANRIVKEFAANPKQHPVIPVIALLFGFFSKLLVLHQSNDQSDAAIAKTLGINPFFAKDYAQALKNYPFEKNIRIITYFRQADLQSKGIDATLEEGAILKELVFKILH